MKKTYIFLMGVVFVFLSYANATTKEKPPIDDPISVAGTLLWYGNAEDQVKGESLIEGFTGTSVKARFILGAWNLNTQKNGEDSRKKGVSLISSAYSEGDKEAGYLMVFIYKEDIDIYGMKNEKKQLIC